MMATGLDFAGIFFAISPLFFALLAKNSEEDLCKMLVCSVLYTDKKPINRCPMAAHL